MPVERLPAHAAELRSRVPTGDSVARTVTAILTAVHQQGDKAVAELEARFGGKYRRVPDDELQKALKGLEPDVREALELARDNITAVAQKGLAGDKKIRLKQGQTIHIREIPVHRAGVYAPGGQAPYPSSVVMGAATARAAGVEEVVVCASAPVMLAAAALCEADEVFAMGGAQAIGALALGTEMVRPVDVIVGPGSRFAQEAKRQVATRVGIDGFAGPSDLVIIATESPQLVLRDALAQAEHGAESVVAVVSPDKELLSAVEIDPGEALLALIETDLETALSFAEDFAPEHLQLIGEDAEALAPRVRKAGCVFVGAGAGTAFGDYVAGSNHVLPTDGAARFASGLNVRHFLRVMNEVHIPPKAAAKLAPAGAAIARAEGFDAHAASMDARMDPQK